MVSIINHLIPDFDESVWEMSSNNKAVSLLKMEHDLQKPYRIKYKSICEKENLNLVGVYKVPFQPIGERLVDFSKLIWHSQGMKFECRPSFEIKLNEGGAELLLRIPNADLVKAHPNKYSIDYSEYSYPSELENYKFHKGRKLKNAYKIMFKKN